MIRITHDTPSLFTQLTGGDSNVPPSVARLSLFCNVTRFLVFAGSATAIGLIAASTATDGAKIGVYVAGAILICCSACCRLTFTETRAFNNSDFGI